VIGLFTLSGSPAVVSFGDGMRRDDQQCDNRNCRYDQIESEQRRRNVGPSSCLQYSKTGGPATDSNVWQEVEACFLLVPLATSHYLSPAALQFRHELLNLRHHGPAAAAANVEQFARAAKSANSHAEVSGAIQTSTACVRCAVT